METPSDDLENGSVCMPSHDSKEDKFSKTLHDAKQLEGNALEELCGLFLPTVYRYVLARVASRQVAEDITSDVFLGLLESLPKLRAEDEHGFTAWVLRIARFKVADFYRRSHAIPPLMLSIMSQTDSSNNNGMYLDIAAEAYGTEPEMTLELHEEWSEVSAALSKLTDEQREVLVQKFALDCDNETIAKSLNKTVGAVKALQHRALLSLARILKHSSPAVGIQITTMDHIANYQ